MVTSARDENSRPMFAVHIKRTLAAAPAGAYLLAAIFVLMALAARAILQPFLGLHVPFLTFFIAVTAAGWYGLGPALFAIALSTLVSVFFFIPPLQTFILTQPDVIAVGVFVGGSMGLASLTYRFHQSSQEARSNHDKIIRIVESITDAYFVLDKNWIYTEVNGKAEALLGRPAHELLGQNVWELFPQAVGTAAWAQLHQAMQDRVSKHFEVYSEPLDRWFENRVYPHDEGLTVMLADITERRRAEDAWHESESRLAAFLEQVPVGIGLLNLEGRWVVSNPLFRHFVEDVIPSRSGVGLWRWRAWGDDGQPLDPSQWPGARGLRGETVPGIDFLYQADNGRDSLVRVSSAPFRDQIGTIIGVILVFQDIDERKRAEDALRESEERFARFMRYLPGLAWIKDHAGRYVFVNEAARRAFGIAHIHGKTDDELFGAETAAQFKHHDATVLASGSPLEAIEKLEHEDGPHFSLVHKFVIPGSRHGARMIGGIAIDVTPHRRAEEALRESEERLSMAMAAGRMGAWDIDIPSGTITWNVKEFGPASHAPPRTLEHLYKLLHPDDAARVKQAAATSQATGHFSDEFRIGRPDDPVRWIAAHGTIITDENGRSVRMVGVTYDITERKQAQGRLERFAEELERQVAERTQELVHSQEQLRALATELNLAEQRERKRLATELHDYLAQTLVLGRLKLGQTRHLPAVPSQCMELIKQTEHVLNEALTYTRTLVADLSPPVLHDFGLPAALTWLGEQMQRHELSVSVHLHNHEGLKLPENQAVLLFQSVRELLLNVAKHAGSGEAMVRLEPRAGDLHIEVRDDGTGFAPAAVMSAPQKTSGVSGKFGLFSIRERMKALGGRFEITSAPGQGTTATIVLPLTVTGPTSREVDLSRPTSMEAVIHAPTAGQSRPDSLPMLPMMRVLLVDDHAMVRQGLRSVLDTYADIDIVGEAWNGEEAVARAETLRPAVVVMDINMPKMNGIEATALIKARHPETIVIGLSVNVGSDTHEAMRAAGASILLTKEAAVEKLYSAIQQAVNGRMDA
jgi:PAS domain S-box-containing protein